MKKVRLLLFVCPSIFYSLPSSAETKPNVGIEIGTFDSIPSEIDGGCCVFYKYPCKKQNWGYIMVNDLAETAYMMINRRLEKFALSDMKNDVFLYRNEKYTLKVTIKGKESSGLSESYKVNGALVVEDNNKNKQNLPSVAIADGRIYM